MRTCHISTCGISAQHPERRGIKSERARQQDLDTHLGSDDRTPSEWRPASDEQGAYIAVGRDLPVDPDRILGTAPNPEWRVAAIADGAVSPGVVVVADLAIPGERPVPVDVDIHLANHPSGTGPVDGVGLAIYRDARLEFRPRIERRGAVTDSPRRIVGSQGRCARRQESTSGHGERRHYRRESPPSPKPTWDR